MFFRKDYKLSEFKLYQLEYKLRIDRLFLIQINLIERFDYSDIKFFYSKMIVKILV